MDTLKQLSLAGLIPVIKVNDAADAVPLCKALADGGLPVAEITFRSDAAKQAIQNVHEALPEVLLGAGTVLTIQQVDEAIEAGAGYIVSPGFNAEVVAYCVEKNIPIVPGCSTPSDIEKALSLGITTVKFFPAEASGGLAMIKAMSAPYGQVRFVPTGGINEKNVNAYLAHPSIVACGGSWMVPEEAVKAKNWEKITLLAKEAVNTILQFSLAHIGINSENKKKKKRTASLLTSLLSLPERETSKSTFVGASFEIMHGKGPGEKGHIAIGTSSVDRAIWHMEKRGFTFDDTTAKKDEKGEHTFIYLKDEIAGFGIHLIKA